MIKALLVVFASLYLWVGSTPPLTGKENVHPFNDGHFQVEVGDIIYVCEEGEASPFQILSTTEGKCGCGRDLVPVQVTQVVQGAAHVQLNDGDVQFSTVGKYICGCNGECPCQAISQAPAPCPCDPDRDMQPVNIW